MNKFRAYLLVCCAIATLCSCAHNSEQQVSTDSISATTPAPEITAKAGVVNEIGQDDFARLVADWNDTSTWQFKGQRPAVVDFNATWCGPCRKLAPILKELAAEYSGRVDFYSIDVDENRPLAIAFGVQSIPMLLICPVEGQPQALVGLYPKDSINQVIEQIVK